VSSFLQIIKFIGTVYTGQGRGRFYIEMPWVMRQLKNLAGFTPHLGTLNLRLTPESIEQRVQLTSQNGLLIKPENGYLPGYLYRAKIFDTTCFIVVPDVPNYPSNSLEIIAAEHLRNKFCLKDGDITTVLTAIKIESEK